MREGKKITTLNGPTEASAETFHHKGTSHYKTRPSQLQDLMGKELEKVISKGMKVERSFTGEKAQRK